MARPKKSSSDLMDNRLPRVRCTGSQLEIIRRNAEICGMSVSEYLRRMALDGTILIKQSKADFALVFEIRKIGININQQTKELHKHGQLPSALPPLWNQLQEVLDRILNSL